jgi:hypothetical protein
MIPLNARRYGERDNVNVDFRISSHRLAWTWCYISALDLHVLSGKRAAAKFFSIVFYVAGQWPITIQNGVAVVRLHDTSFVNGE